MPVVLTLPSVKGSRLDHTEMESNLTDLRDAVNLAKYETDVTTVTPYVAGVNQVILMDCSAGDKIIELPDASLSTDLVYVVKKVDISDFFLRIEAFGADLISHASAYTIQAHDESVTIICDGVGWETIGHQASHDHTVGLKLTDTTVANTITETVVYSHQFPANSFAKAGRVISITSGSYSTEGVNTNFTVVVKMNGVPMHSLTRVGTSKALAGWKLWVEGTIRTTGATGTYVDLASLHDGEATFTEPSSAEIVIDTTVPILYEIYIQWESASVDNIFTCAQGQVTVGGGH